MRATSTSDIDHRLIEALANDLSPELELRINEHSIFLRSAEPPSWIQFFADAQWWVKGLGAYAALYVAELVKEAGKETWKDRVKIAHAAVGATNSVCKLARSLVKLRSRLPERTQLVLGLPVPDDYFGVRFQLIGREEELLAAEIALFARYVPLVQALLETEGIKSGKGSGPISLLLGEDSSLRVAWMNPQSLRIEERILRLPSEA